MIFPGRRMQRSLTSAPNSPLNYGNMSTLPPPLPPSQTIPGSNTIENGGPAAAPFHAVQPVPKPWRSSLLVLFTLLTTCSWTIWLHSPEHNAAFAVGAWLFIVILAGIATGLLWLVIKASGNPQKPSTARLLFVGLLVVGMGFHYLTYLQASKRQTAAAMKTLLTVANTAHADAQSGDPKRVMRGLDTLDRALMQFGSQVGPRDKAAAQLMIDFYHDFVQWVYGVQIPFAAVEEAGGMNFAKLDQPDAIVRRRRLVVEFRDACIKNRKVAESLQQRMKALSTAGKTGNSDFDGFLSGLTKPLNEARFERMLKIRDIDVKTCDNYEKQLDILDRTSGKWTIAETGMLIMNDNDGLEQLSRLLDQMNALAAERRDVLQRASPQPQTVPQQ